MPVEVNVADSVLVEIGELDIPLAPLLALLAGLYDDERMQEQRENRDPETPGQFAYRLTGVIGDRLHTFTFWVDDSRDPEKFYVVGMLHEAGGPFS
jgi:hypothetical protein